MKGKKRFEKLGPRLKELYQLMKNAKAVFGTETPAIRELVRELGLDPKIYTSRIHGELEELVALGLLEKVDIPTRPYRAIGPPPEDIDWKELLL